MQRRRFLALAGAGAVTAAGALAGRAVGGPSGDLVRSAPEPRGRDLEAPERGSRRIVWSAETSAPLVALTFDDGPDPDLTPGILDVLERFGVRATFMAMGYNAMRNPRLMQEVVRAGHEVGNHTWSHRNLAHESPASTFRQLERGARAIEAVTGQRTRLFRPPRGELTGAAVRAAAVLRHDVVMWSVERKEPAGTAPRALAEAYRRRTRAGDVVLLHDGYGRGTFAPDEEWAESLRRRRDDELAALPLLVRGLLDAGLEPVTVSELMAADESASRSA